MLKEWVSEFDSMSSKKRSKTLINNESWVSHCSPKTVQELAVHKGKITELETCLRQKLSGNSKTPFILLTGPSGCGKTTTLNVLCKELNVTVVEWLNPLVNDNEFMTSDSSFQVQLYTDSQLTKFSDFLFRVNRYSSLCFDASNTTDKKLFLIKDFPNAFIENPNKFYDLITKYGKLSSVYPCVFIVTDSEQSSNIKRLLFPPSLLNNLKIDVIKFNSIASTAMMKALLKLVNGAPNFKLKNFIQPNKEMLEEIIEISNGDIRSACLSLEFISLKVKSSLKPSKTSKDKCNSTKDSTKLSKNRKKIKGIHEKSSYIGVKDTGVSLFRVLGKVLHCKRMETMDPSESNLPDHLIHHSRNTLTFNPDEIYEKSCLSTDTYCAFLHQNYPEFSNSLESISITSDSMSDADILLGEWSVKSNMSSYQVSLVTRGVLFSNGVISADVPKKTGWMPLHKPQMFMVQTKCNEIKNSSLELFRLMHSSISELSTVVLPYLGKLNLQNVIYSADEKFNPQQIKHIKDLNNFNMINKITLEKLDEKDSLPNAELDGEDGVITEPFLLSSGTTDPLVHTNCTTDLNSEEYLIEDTD